MSISALVFGSLGTLTETSSLHQQAFNDVFVEEGLNWQWDEATYRRLLTHVGGTERILAYAAEDTSPARIDADRAAELHARKTEHYAKLVLSGALDFRPGVERLLTEASSAGLARGLATGTSLANIEASLEATGNRIGLGDFDAHTVRPMIDRAKPAPDAHRLCVELLGVDPSEVLAIEDTADGVASAVAAGLCVVATPGQYVTDQNFDHARLVLSDLGDPGRPGRRLDAQPDPPDGVATLGWLVDAIEGR